jgi:hypothetical protein
MEAAWGSETSESTYDTRRRPKLEDRNMVSVLIPVHVTLSIFLDSLTSVGTLWNMHRMALGYLEMVAADNMMCCVPRVRV